LRDIFTDIFADERADPMQAARRNMRPPLPRRFYAAATVGESEGGFRVLLDGRPARTPARNALAAPTRALAHAIAAEWDAQSETIDPARMPLTRLANSILDGVAASPAPVVTEVEKYLASDLLFYRAEGPDGLVERQARHWDPILDWAHATLVARFVLAQGVVYAAQPEPAVAKARASIPHDPWRLGAVHSITTLTGSALIALAALHGALSTDDAWEAAHVDEDWNMDQWGRDDIALARRASRFAEFAAATTVLATAC